jgi:hypothetical protein
MGPGPVHAGMVGHTQFVWSVSFCSSVLSRSRSGFIMTSCVICCSTRIYVFR